MSKTKTKAVAKPKPKSKLLLASKETQALVPAGKAALQRPHLQSVMARRDYTREQIDLMKQTVARGSTDLEFSYFLEFCKQVGLNPLKKEIHLVKRYSRKDNAEVMSIQTGIDGFRSVADRTGNYAPSDRQPEVKYDAEKRLFSVTVWIQKFVPKDKSWHEYSATAIWDEFCPTEMKDGRPSVPWMWAKMPVNQLEKCAEAKALRRGFPNELGGMYVNEEMQRADFEPQQPEDQGPSKIITHESLQAQKRERERGTLEPGKEENRGHNDTGFERLDSKPIIDHGPQPGTRAVPPAEKKKEEKDAARRAKLELLDTTVEKVDSRMRKLKPDQVNENKKLRAQNKPEKHEAAPYFIAHCAGDVVVYVWDRHLFRALAQSQRKRVEWMIERRMADDGSKEFISLQEIVSQGGVRYVVDPQSKDWLPETSTRTEAPAAPDGGEMAPERVNPFVQNTGTSRSDADENF